MACVVYIFQLFCAVISERCAAAETEALTKLTSRPGMGALRRNDDFTEIAAEMAVLGFPERSLKALRTKYDRTVAKASPARTVPRAPRARAVVPPLPSDADYSGGARAAAEAARGAALRSGDEEEGKERQQQQQQQQQEQEQEQERR